MRIRIAGYVPAEGRYSMGRVARTLHAHLAPYLAPDDTAVLDDSAMPRTGTRLLHGPRVKLHKRVLHPLRQCTRPWDVLHLVDNDYALGIPPGKCGRTVVTVHDMMPFLLHDNPAHAFSGRLGWWFYRRTLANLARAGRIACVSQFTRHCLLEQLDELPAPVAVIYNGIDQAMHPLPAGDPMLADFRLRHDLTGKWVVLHVGSCAPYKRIDALLHIAAGLRRTLGDTLCLLKVGGRFSDAQRALVGVLGLGDALVHLTGLDEDQLVCAYNAADVLLWPSQFEGFGLPVLEAMACGTPVVCSNGGALAEVAGDAAATHKPEDHAGMTAACHKVLEDAAYADDLRSRGRARAQDFTWDTAARRYYALYKEVAAGA
ncbi:MAG: glycosyltransferase family 4 protein [Candidatus Hydrogenedentota bacterium]